MGTAVSQVTVPVARPRSRVYSVLSVLAALVIFLGFARTYYFRSLTHLTELTTLVRIHGLIMTAWLAILILQTRLVETRRTAMHRRVGLAGGFIAAGAIVTGVLVAIRAVQIGHAPTGIPPLSFLIIPLGDIAIFGSMIALALTYRNRPEIHKRLIVVSTIAILPPGIARWPWIWVAHNPLRFFGIADLILLGFVLYDVYKTRQLHPAYLWGGTLLVVSHPLRLALAGTTTWLTIARWITGVH